MHLRRRLLAWATALASGTTMTAAAAEDPPPTCGDLLIVLDRSGSMAQCNVGDKTKEQIAKEALNMVFEMYPNLPTGLEVFPDSIGNCGASCAAGKVVVDVSGDGTKAVADYLATMPTSCGGTPTGVSMEVARDYPDEKWLVGKEHFVLLLTDGQPTCDDGDNPDADGGAPTPCNGGGCTHCQNPFRVYDALAALRERGIKTFVVGFEGDGTCSSACTPMGMPFNPDTLDRMAEEGGLPNETGDHKYYAATNAESLREALRTIVGKVAGGTSGGCARGGGGEGGGGSGGGGGTGGQGGVGGDGGTGGRGQRPAHGGGCGCHASGGSIPGGLGFMSLAAVGGLQFLRRRRTARAGRDSRVAVPEARGSTSEPRYRW